MSAPSEPVLELRGFGVAYRETVVLAEVDLSVPATGVTVLLGPAGTGKSTLLRSLAGLHDGQPELRHWGQARYCGRALGDGPRPALAVQDLRYFVNTVHENLAASLPDRRRLSRDAQRERLLWLLDWAQAGDLEPWLDREAVQLPLRLQRLVALLRSLATGAPLVCLDETTARLDEDGAERLVQLMRLYARTHAVLFVTHHQGHARAAADTCALMAGGRLLEQGPAAAFFAGPGTDAGRHFLASGSVAVASPMAKPEHLAEGVAPPPPLPVAAVAAVSEWSGPRGFRWLIPGRVGGGPRPGIVASTDDDLAALHRVGVTLLVTLEETATVPAAALTAAGLEGLHFPVVDMRAPALPPTMALCRTLELRLQTGSRIALHCRAGHGRTGTLLACLLIWLGHGAVEALDEVRAVNPKWVSSEEQVQFLGVFSQAVLAERAGPAPGSSFPGSPQPPQGSLNVH